MLGLRRDLANPPGYLSDFGSSLVNRCSHVLGNLRHARCLSSHVRARKSARSRSCDPARKRGRKLHARAALERELVPTC